MIVSYTKTVSRVEWGIDQINNHAIEKIQDYTILHSIALIYICHFIFQR